MAKNKNKTRLPMGELELVVTEDNIAEGSIGELISKAFRYVMRKQEGHILSDVAVAVCNHESDVPDIEGEKRKISVIGLQAKCEDCGEFFSAEIIPHFTLKVYKGKLPGGEEFPKIPTHKAPTKKIPTFEEFIKNIGANGKLSVLSPTEVLDILQSLGIPVDDKDNKKNTNNNSEEEELRKMKEEFIKKLTKGEFDD